LRFSSGSRYVATGAHDGGLRIWDLRKSTLAKSFKAHTGACSVVRYSPTDNYLASGGLDGFAYVHSLSTGKTVSTFRIQKDTVDVRFFSCNSAHI
jgi:WD40 repeat protein